jgi:hypothetical protein
MGPLFPAEVSVAGGGDAKEDESLAGAGRYGTG